MNIVVLTPCVKKFAVHVFLPFSRHKRSLNKHKCVFICMHVLDVYLARVCMCVCVQGGILLIFALLSLSTEKLVQMLSSARILCMVLTFTLFPHVFLHFPSTKRTTVPHLNSRYPPRRLPLPPPAPTPSQPHGRY